MPWNSAQHSATIPTSRPAGVPLSAALPGVLTCRLVAASSGTTSGFSTAPSWEASPSPVRGLGQAQACPLPRKWITSPTGVHLHAVTNILILLLACMHVRVCAQRRAGHCSRLRWTCSRGIVDVLVTRWEVLRTRWSVLGDGRWAVFSDVPPCSEMHWLGAHTVPGYAEPGWRPR